MGVIVRSLAASAPALLSQKTSFTDTFTRANQNGWGDNWLYTLLLDGFVNNPGSTQWTINANRGRITDVGGVGSETSLVVPRDLLWLQTKRRTQFSQITFAGNSGTGFSFGPTVLANPNTTSVTAQSDGLYTAIISLVGAGLVLIRRTRYNGLWTVTTDTTLASVVNLIVAGDVVRLEATPTSDGSSIDLEVFKNGVSLLTATDAAATRINVGCPSFLIGMSTNGNFCEISNFQGGIF